MIQCARHISGITFLRYPQCYRIGKPINERSRGSQNTKTHKKVRQPKLSPPEVDNISINNTDIIEDL